MKRVHFIGIKGVGMSALGLVMHGLGYHVTGSDVASSYGDTGTLLSDAGIISNDFDASVVTPDIDQIVLGTSFGSDNPELAKARELELPIVTYSEMLQKITADKKLIAVSGTHGKTTTTSLLTYLLKNAGLDPSWIIGTTHVSGLPAHGGSGASNLFVLEADEYKKAADDPTPKFLDYTPYGLIVNNIEHDHPDVYPTFAEFKEAFAKLITKVNPEGVIVANGDDKNVLDILPDGNRNIKTFGFGEGNDYHIEIDPRDNAFRLYHAHLPLGPFNLQLRGTHNFYNAAAAVTMALALGATEDSIKQCLPHFTNVERRYQTLGNMANGTIVIDDYAHHPSAITTTLETAKKDYPGKELWVTFRAHTYSRTKTLLAEFAQAFGPADVVIITDIFASAREKEVTITGQELADQIGQHHPDVRFVPEAELQDYLAQNTPADAVLIVMGASNINEIGEALVKNR